jgi:hypothetical protein
MAALLMSKLIHTLGADGTLYGAYECYANHAADCGMLQCDAYRAHPRKGMPHMMAPDVCTCGKLDAELLSAFLRATMCSMQGHSAMALLLFQLIAKSVAGYQRRVRDAIVGSSTSTGAPSIQPPPRVTESNPWAYRNAHGTLAGSPSHGIELFADDQVVVVAKMGRLPAVFLRLMLADVYNNIGQLFAAKDNGSMWRTPDKPNSLAIWGVYEAAMNSSTGLDVGSCDGHALLQCGVQAVDQGRLKKAEKDWRRMRSARVVSKVDHTVTAAVRMFTDGADVGIAADEYARLVFVDSSVFDTTAYELTDADVNADDDKRCPARVPFSNNLEPLTDGCGGGHVCDDECGQLIVYDDDWQATQAAHELACCVIEGGSFRLEELRVRLVSARAALATSTRIYGAPFGSCAQAVAKVAEIFTTVERDYALQADDRMVQMSSGGGLYDAAEGELAKTKDTCAGCKRKRSQFDNQSKAVECPRCRTYYHSEECQQLDAAAHADECDSRRQRREQLLTSTQSSVRTEPAGSEADVAKVMKAFQKGTVGCGHCGVRGRAAKLKKCSQCRLVYYCGLDCQKKAWRLHKYVCKKK